MNGIQLREIGMRSAELAEASTGSNFATIAYDAIRLVAKRQSEVHVDDILQHITVKPRHPNCWGSVWRKAIKDGTLVGIVGRRNCTTDPAKHAHAYPVYKSGIH